MRRCRFLFLIWIRAWPAYVFALTIAAAPAHAETVVSDRPFGEQEELTYRVSIGGVGRGSGRLRVERTAPLRGEPVVLLHFEFDARVGPFVVSHRSRSWLSTERWASLRYQVEERAPLKHTRKLVEIYPDERRWVGRRDQGKCGTPEPLDELSFIYALRALPPALGGNVRLNRHYDPRRNPAQVRWVRRERIRVPAGEFETVLVEMEVRDPERCRGRTVLRLNLTDDELRLPVRLASSCPAELVLELQTPAGKQSQPTEHRP